VAFESRSQTLTLQGEVFAKCHLLKSIFLPGSIENLDVGVLEAGLLTGLVFESPSHLAELSMVITGNPDGRGISIPDSVTSLRITSKSADKGVLVIIFGRESRLRTFAFATDLRICNPFLTYGRPPASFYSRQAAMIPAARGFLSRFSEQSLKRIRDMLEF
jgi:hypothetical protein